ncbi:MAG: AMP-binding protein [Vulcanimicrobiota bacterium]
MTVLKLVRVLVQVLRSGLIPWRLTHWNSIYTAWKNCGPGFAFLSEVAAARFGERIALIDDDGPLSFSELHLDVQSAAGFLHRRGVQPNQTIAILFSNHRGFVIALLATTRLGADVLPLNPGLPPNKLKEILSAQKVDLLLHENEFEHSEEIDPMLDSLPYSQIESGPTSLPPTPRAGQLAVLTSGTTGVSKAARRRPGVFELLPVTSGLLRDLPLKMYQPSALAIPFYHGYGIATLALSLAMGSALHTSRRYKIGPILERIESSEPAVLITVPTLLWRWLKESPDKPTLAAIITGSAPLDATLCDNLLERFGPILFNLYGSTEVGLIALATPRMLQQTPGCVGLPLPGNEVRVVGPNRGIGKLEARGPLVLQPRADGWRDTGDLGRFENDFLVVCGRADSMIVSGGENVYPHELEEALSAHPALTDVGVLVLADKEFGQRLVAAVVRQEDSDLTESELKTWLSERLERFKLPRSIHFMKQIPRNALGKLDRRELGAAIDA